MIELKDVSKYYNSNGITNLGLRHINLKFNKGEIVAITGDSGSGKSTLLNVIAKLDSFDEGEIYYKGNETSYFSVDDMDDFRKNKVGFIFQNYNIIDSYTVLENVMLPLTLRGYSKKDAKAKALELIKKVKLSGKEKHRGSKLSGGEKQRCVIARALASNCEILVCDEPTGNLDSNTGKEIIQLIKEVANDKLVLIVTHDFDSVIDIVTRKIRIADGEVVEDVIFNKIEDDKDEELDLDYKRLSKKIDFTIAKNNILYTPKKTTFVGTIFFVISLIIIFVFQFINSTMNDLNISNPYTNRQDNRVYVYDINHNMLDIEKIKQISNNYEINPFYEDTVMNMTISEKGNIEESIYYYDYYDYGCLYNDHVPYTIQEGKDLETNSDDEIIIIVPNEENNKVKELSKYLNKEVNIFTNDYGSVASNLDVKCKLAGIATSSIIDRVTFTKNNKLKNELISGCLDYSVKYDNQIVVYEKSNDKSAPKIILPLNSDDKQENISREKISFVIESLYNFKNYSISYENVETPKLVIGKYYNFEEYVFEISLYDNDTKKIINKVNKLGYEADKVNALKDDNSVETFIMNLVSYALMISAFVSQFIFFLITYFILSKVYSSRKKDYEILRVLGITKKDMKVIVKFELVIISMITMLAAYILFVILIYSLKELEMFRPIRFTTSLIYMLSIIILTNIIAYFFNKRLFKFSVAKSLKGE